MLQNLPDNFKIVEIFDKSGHTEWTTLSAAVGRDRKVSISIENYSIESVAAWSDCECAFRHKAKLYNKSVGSGWGTVDWAVTCDSRVPRFVSSHW